MKKWKNKETNENNSVRRKGNNKRARAATVRRKKEEKKLDKQKLINGKLAEQEDSATRQAIRRITREQSKAMIPFAALRLATGGCRGRGYEKKKRRRWRKRRRRRMLDPARV